MPDKRLVLGYVKQSEIHNRILEEERCWREYKNRKRDRARRHYRNSSKSPSSLLQSRSDSAEREWRRERKRKLEENSQITASAAAPTTALDFWRQVVRCSGDSDGRWGHDGFKELEKPGPLVPLSIEVNLRSRASVCPRKPSFNSRSSPPVKSSVPSSSSSSSSYVSERNLKKRKKGRKTKSKKEKTKVKQKRKRRRREYNTSCSCSSSQSSDDSDQDVEWVEKKT
ncbi:unnamed protein product [Hydatigera taeniaeformis]|uniref:Corepressor interacting with RBPJ 1 n=1 Tax=Hydatigena taeniaeformis TaxID=6205 RepID=A0A0R3X7X1_HYDTA|nr:unnamed protein product [Hydatigera taeniaeformis]